MSESSKSTTSGSIGFCGLLTIVFITLKLLKVIDWSWWWVWSELHSIGSGLLAQFPPAVPCQPFPMVKRHVRIHRGGGSALIRRNEAIKLLTNRGRNAVALNTLRYRMEQLGEDTSMFKQGAK